MNAYFVLESLHAFSSSPTESAVLILLLIAEDTEAQ